MDKPKKELDETGKKIIFPRYIIRNGKKIFPKNAKCFRFAVSENKPKK